MPSPIIAHLEFATQVCCNTYIISYSLIDNDIILLFFISNENERMFETIAEVFEHCAGIETSQILRIKAKEQQIFEIREVYKFPES